jgi:hypothetical protein
MGSPKYRSRSPTVGAMRRDCLVVSSVDALCLKRRIEAMERGLLLASPLGNAQQSRCRVSHPTLQRLSVFRLLNGAELG